MKYEIRFYLSLEAFNNDYSSFKEYVEGDHYFVTTYSKRKIRNSIFNYYKIIKL